MAESSPTRLLLVLVLCATSSSLFAAARDLRASSSSTSQRRKLPTISEMEAALLSHSPDYSSSFSENNPTSLSDAFEDFHASLYSLSSSGSDRRLLFDVDANRQGNLLLHAQQQQQQQQGQQQKQQHRQQQQQAQQHQHSSFSTASSSPLLQSISSPSSRATLEPASEAGPNLSSVDIEAAILSSAQALSSHADPLAFGRDAATAHSDVATETAVDGGASREDNDVAPERERAARGSEVMSISVAREEETHAAPLLGSEPAIAAMQTEVEAEAEATAAEVEDDDDAKVDGGGVQQLLFTQELDDAAQLLGSAASLIADEEEEQEEEFERARELRGSKRDSGFAF